MEGSTNVGIETWGGGSRKQKAKPSKLSLVVEISIITKTKSLDITNLSIQELEEILEVAKEGKTIDEPVPISRFKKPYVALLHTIFPYVKLDKLSVAALKELLGAFNEN